MKTRSLRSKIFVSFFIIVIAIGISIASLGFYVIKIQIIDRAQTQVKSNLQIARAVYNSEIDKMKIAFDTSVYSDDPEALAESLAVLKENLDLDYIYVVNSDDCEANKNAIISAAFSGESVGATRIVTQEEFSDTGDVLASELELPIKFTPKARPTDKKTVKKLMVIEYARPVFDTSGKVIRVVGGGEIINKNFEIVDKIHDFVFEDKSYDSKPMGTVTIFQDDVRIATNVLNDENERAVGTRVSDDVYKQVMEEGRPWFGRAFVVTDWYLTAYEDIRDIDGNIIGMLYVGVLEKPFYDFGRNMLFVFLGVMFAVTVLGVILSYILAIAISRPVVGLLVKIKQISDGNLKHRADKGSSIRELNELAFNFNSMTKKLQERDEKLSISNEKLENLNKSYLDLIGFVSHELKGILASTVLNAYAVRDGFLGMINFKQRKALDSVARNLDYLTATVKNFLNLSRIEKGELNLNMMELSLKEDIFETSIESLMPRAEERHIHVINRVDEAIEAKGDADLLLIVANNLIGNAIKYGDENGEVVISSRALENMIEVEVYNDGRVITEEEKEKLFKKFSRLTNEGSKKVRGTGLGLFITKDIVEKHGGTIRAESREKGNAFIFTLQI